MSHYFYAVASLPTLSYETESFMTPENFLEFCRYQLSSSDYAEICRLSLLPQAESCRTAAGIRYFRFERGVRNALVRLRAARMGIDASDFIATTREGNDYSDDASAAELARAAFSAATPLLAEETLDRGRWQMLAQLETGNFFNLDVLVIYYFRILVLTRKGSRSHDAGVAGYESVYRNMTESMQNTLLVERD